MALHSIVPISVLLISLLLGILLQPYYSNSHKLFEGTNHLQRVLLLTAHPDDECMFFAPTILSLLSRTHITQNEYLHPEVYSLCLSVGDADGLGFERKDELGRSLDVLGVGEDKRWILDHPDLKDNITAKWDSTIIARTIKPYILQYNISTILTFDRQGISSHPNHFSLPFGVAELISSLSDEVQIPPRLYTLVTVPSIHKYLGPLAALLAKLDLNLAALLQYLGIIKEEAGRGHIAGARLPVFVSGIQGYRTALQAMMQHRSQLVWFRWLYVSFSRYMWVNEWVEFVPNRTRL